MVWHQEALKMFIHTQLQECHSKYAYRVYHVTTGALNTICVTSYLLGSIIKVYVCLDHRQGECLYLIGY